MRVCLVTDCSRKSHARGLCINHYLQEWKGHRLANYPLIDPRRSNIPSVVQTCTLDGCGRPHKTRGLCQMHYSRYRRRGLSYPMPSREASTMDHLMEHVVKVPGPLATYCWMADFTLRSGYPSMTVPGTTVPRRCHVIAYESLVGPVDEGLHLHHLCEQPRCCNPEHLQPLTPHEHKQAHRELRRLARSAR